MSVGNIVIVDVGIKDKKMWDLNEIPRRIQIGINIRELVGVVKYTGTIGKGELGHYTITCL